MNNKFSLGQSLVAIISLFQVQISMAAPYPYAPRGIGGGGAMSALSFSPYTHLWFVGTDMGTLFRSIDEGKSWEAISQKEVTFSGDLAHSPSVGFSSDGKTVFFSEGGKKPKRSMDGGLTWRAIPIPLEKEEYVHYWLGDSSDSQFILCATTQGLFKSFDKGMNWRRVTGITGDSTGTFIRSEKSGLVIFHANTKAIFMSKNHAHDFEPWFTSQNGIRSFTGAADRQKMTLSFIDTNGAEACSWVRNAKNSGEKDKADTVAECGFVWVSTGDLNLTPQFSRTDKEGGRFIRMAENDPDTIYVTAGNWARQYGTKVWVSRNAGKTWDLRFHIYNWDTHPYSPWPRDLLEYSAIGLDIGWDDGAYPSFVVNQRNSAQAGGTGNYFLHVTGDFGKKWKAPFTAFADSGERAPKKKWKSIGLEMTSVQRLKFNPKAPQIGYAAVADMGGLVTEDGGVSWRISKSKYNTNYDYAFDPRDENVVFSASGSVHDFPLGNNAIWNGMEGGIFRSNNRGKSWIRLTPDNHDWNTEFLSVAYDPIHKTIYGGTRGRGVGRSSDGGATWEYFNDGLPESGKTIPQIEIDPQNGNVYTLLAGDAPTYSNQAVTGIYLLDVAQGTKQWRLLRGNIRPPATGVALGVLPWWFPNSFAVDFSRKARDVLWLTDMESKGAWLASGVWKSTDSGQNWDRLKQYTHPSSIILDTKNTNHVFVSGLYQLDGGWGEGGAIYSTDGGETWKKNESMPFLANLDGTTLDPNHPGKLFYLFFGGGMLYGPEPK